MICNSQEKYIYACGLWVSEAIRLTTADYSAEQRTLYIQPSKFLKDRLIPIGQRVASNLEKLLDLRQRLFGIGPEGPFFLFLPQRLAITGPGPAPVSERRSSTWESIDRSTLIKAALRALIIYISSAELLPCIA